MSQSRQYLLVMTLGGYKRSQSQIRAVFCEDAESRRRVDCEIPRRLEGTPDGVLALKRVDCETPRRLEGTLDGVLALKGCGLLDPTSVEKSVETSL